MNDAGCQTFSNNNPNVNFCTKYFSLTDDAVLQGCGNGSVNYLCESGYCVDVATSICYSAPTVGKSFPVACEADQDCQSTPTGPFGLVIENQCSCGLNPTGTKYCSVLPGDSVYDDYDDMVRK